MALSNSVVKTAALDAEPASPKPQVKRAATSNASDSHNRKPEVEPNVAPMPPIPAALAVIDKSAVPPSGAHLALSDDEIPQAPFAANAQAALSASTDLGAASSLLTDHVAAAIVPNGGSGKAERAARNQPPSVSADTAKSQTQSTNANVFTALATAASRSFTDQPATKDIPVHALAIAAGENKPFTGAANETAANSHAAAAAPSATTHAAAPSAVAQVATIDYKSTGAQVQAPADVNAVVASSGAATSTAHSNAPPVQLAANLHFQTTHAGTAPDVNALAVTIASKNEAGLKHFDIRLDPPELGRVDVRLSLDDAGKAQASLAVEKPQTLELLQKDSSTLERALKDAGLDLSQNSLNFSLKGQQQQSGNGNSPTSRGRAMQVRAIASVDAAPTILSSSGVSASDTRLDIRV